MRCRKRLWKLRRPHWYYDIRVVRQRLPDVGEVLLLRGPVPGVHIEPLLHQSRSHIVLSGERVGARYEQLRAACCQYLAKVRSLGLQMYRQRYALALKRPALPEVLLQAP